MYVQVWQALELRWWKWNGKSRTQQSQYTVSVSDACFTQPPAESLEISKCDLWASKETGKKWAHPIIMWSFLRYLKKYKRVPKLQSHCMGVYTSSSSSKSYVSLDQIQVMSRWQLDADAQNGFVTSILISFVFLIWPLHTPQTNVNWHKFVDISISIWYMFIACKW